MFLGTRIMHYARSSTLLSAAFKQVSTFTVLLHCLFKIFFFSIVRISFEFGCKGITYYLYNHTV